MVGSSLALALPGIFPSPVKGEKGWPEGEREDFLLRTPS